MNLMIVFLVTGLILANQAAFSLTKNNLTVIYSDGFTESYQLELDSGTSHLLSQGYSWMRDDFSRYNLVGYSIDGGDIVLVERHPQGNFSIKIPMDKPHSVMFYAVVQFPLVLTGISDYEFDPKSPTGDGWFDAGTDIRVVFPGTIQTSDGTRQVFLSWALDNNTVNLIKEGSTEMPTETVSMTSFHKIEFFSKTQHKVDVLSDLGEPYGSGWYDLGSFVSIGVKTNDVFGNVFDGWEGKGVEFAENPAAILVDSPKKITATWRIDYSIIGAPTIIVSAVILAIMYVKLIQKARSQSSQKTISFAKHSGSPDQYDSEIAMFLAGEAIAKLDSYLSTGLVDQERYLRLKEAISKI